MKIINIVASGDLHQSVDFNQLIGIGERFRFDPNKYHGGYLSLQEGQATIYRSGKYILCGIKSVNHIPELWSEVSSQLSPYLDMSSATFPVIQNNVGMTDIQRKISLTKICVNFSLESVEFEPEVFPGLVWRMKVGTCLIFSSGKILMMGVKSVDQLNQMEACIRSKIAQL